MTKFFLLLLVGLVFEALGVAMIGKGLKGAGPHPSLRDLFEQGITSPHVWIGFGFEVVFFGILLFLLSRWDVSLVWPLTSMGFILTVLVARFYLHEDISPARWVGVALIVVGAALVSWK